MGGSDHGTYAPAHGARAVGVREKQENGVSSVFGSFAVKTELTPFICVCEENADFEMFLQSVKIDVNARKVHRGEYDPVIKDIDAYVRKLEGHGSAALALG